MTERPALDRWLDWFGDHSPEWLETLIRSTGIHNFLPASPFTATQRLFLANGLRFIMTPSRTQSARFVEEYLHDNTRGWPRFQRTLTSQLLRQLDPTTVVTDSAKLAKFRLAATHTGHAEHMLESQRLELSPELRLLEQYCNLTRPLLKQSVQLSLPRRQRLNFTPADSQFVRELMADAAITCKPADKNLGLTLVTTAWYEMELTRMLADRVTYARFTAKQRRGGKVYPLAHLMRDLQKELQAIVTRHESTLEDWCPAHSSEIVKYLRHKQPLTTAVVPTIYLLIKVHKAVLCGRPIVPCTRWITTPASVVVDHLLQEILRAAKLPQIVQDTKSLIRMLEATPQRHKNAVLVTADIASLYTNIDTEMGLRLVREFLTEQQVESRHADLIMSLLAFVMRNAYLQFKGQTYHQIDGTAMGTAAAPTYANIIVAQLERVVMRDFIAVLHLYLRFLDDIFAYIKADQAEAFQKRMNSLHPKLKFEFVSHPTEASFLDLLIFKGPRFASTGVFDLRTHQKKLNAYLYPPWNSNHTEAMKKAFIQTELMRYIRNTSSAEDYFALKHVFFSRLRDRGYPGRFLAPLFNDIFYDDRRFFLWPSTDLLSHPHLDSHPPHSVTLLRRIDRLRTCLQLDAPVFVIPYSPLSAQTDTRRLLLKYWGVLQLIETGMPQPIIAYQSYPSLMSQLVFMKAKQHEKERDARFAVPSSKQSILRFTPRPATAMTIELLPDDTPGTDC